MGNTVPRELRTWGDEVGIFARRWWWTLAVIVVMTWLPPVPAVQVAFTWAVLALVLLGAAWAILTARRMTRRSDEKWKRDVGRRIHRSWVDVAIRLGLGVPDYTTRGTVPPAIGYPAWDGWKCSLRVSLPQGLGREHLQAQTGLLAQAFGARRAVAPALQRGEQGSPRGGHDTFRGSDFRLPKRQNGHMVRDGLRCLVQHQ